jgi:hypothetical protein
MGSEGQGTAAPAGLASAACSQLWAANHLAAAALRRLECHAEVPAAQLVRVQAAAGALIEAVTPVVSNRQLVEHVVGVAYELHRA